MAVNVYFFKFRRQETQPWFFLDDGLVELNEYL